jgi:hypothetical protein
MGFLDLFRPRWKHSDPAVRIDAVKSLTPEDVVELGHVVKRDKDARVRRLALKKISDPQLLEEVAEHDPDEALRRDAADKRSELLLSVALSGEDESASLAAVANLTSLRVLVDVICRAEFAAVQQAALERLRDDKLLGEVIKKCKDAKLRRQALLAIRDESALADLACSDGPKDLLLEALERIKDPGQLQQVASRAKLKLLRAEAEKRLPVGASVAKPEKSVVSKTAVHKAPAATPVVDAAAAEREELCRRLEAAAKTEDFEDADGFVSRLRKSWAELPTIPTSHPASKRFERAAARYLERRDVFAKKQAARSAGPVSQAASASAQALLERMEQLAKAESEAKLMAEQRRREQEARDEEQRRLQAERRVEQDKSRSEQQAKRDAVQKARQAERDAELAKEGEQRQEREKQRTESLQKNLEKLLAVAQKLVELSEKEDLQLKPAEQALKEAQEAVMALTSLPAERRREARQRYDEARSKLVIRVHALREQKDWERFANVPRLESLCAQVEELLQVVNSDLDIDPQAAADHLKKLQSEWKTVGPAPKEKSEALWQRFKQTADAVYEAVRSAGEAERAENVKLREDLIKQIEGLTEVTDWRVATDTVKAWQAEWKQLGPVPRAQKEQGEELWKRFRAACDAFFEKRKGHVAELVADREDNQRKKEELCIRVERLVMSTDFKTAAELIKKFQADWKLIGPAPKEHNEALWQRFRKGCDAFFERRKVQHEKLDAERLGNQKKKEEVCQKAEVLASREDVAQDSAEAELKQLMADWRRIGPAPRQEQEALWKRFRAACDKVFQAGREVELPPEPTDGRKFENKLPLGALLLQLQSEQESSEEELAKEPTEVVAESSAVPITESAVSPSQVSDGWARAAESEWNQIDERISSGQTPQPDDEAATDKK